LSGWLIIPETNGRHQWGQPPRKFQAARRSSPRGVPRPECGPVAPLVPTGARGGPGLPTGARGPLGRAPPERGARWGGPHWGPKRGGLLGGVPPQLEWRRRELNPRPRSRGSGVYERSRRSDLIPRSPCRLGCGGPAPEMSPVRAERSAPGEPAVVPSGAADERPGGVRYSGLVTRRRERTRGCEPWSSHLFCSWVFYEASQDLGSQPSPRIRPRRSLSSPGMSCCHRV